MDSSNWPQKGNKLFLPKIEYSRLENSTNIHWDTTKSNGDSEELIVQEDIENDDSERSASQIVEQRNDQTFGSFTKFSVLPPIQDKQSSRGRSHRDKRQSEKEFHPVLNEQDSYPGRRGSFLRRQTVLLTGDREAITLQKTNTDNLKIVGKRYSGLNNRRNHQQTAISMEENNRTRTGNHLSRPSTTPNASHPLEFGVKSSPLSDTENDSGLMVYPGIPLNRSGASRQNGRRLSKFRRFNSDTSNEGKEEKAEEFCRKKNKNYSILSRAKLPETNLLLNPSENTLNTEVNGKSGYISNCRSPRPISRCHIDINMNESENMSFNLMEDQKVSSETSNVNCLFDTTISDVSSSAPFIQISTEGNSSFEGPTENEHSSSIQILINSLDLAKGETLQDEKLEQPKMSVREQRRRSALCRANSKQVDDFLLVHNLRDLGLL
jgi:hypothetical protein